MDVIKKKPQNTPQPKPNKARKIKKNALLVAVVAVLVLGVLFAWNASAKKSLTPNKNQYQAVFLSNGQVYFGKISKLGSEYVDLADVYYLQMQGSGSQADSQSVADAVSNPDSSGENIKLIKLGNELHGPTDQMAVNKQQILFWENMKDDSKVSQAIKKYQEDAE